MASGINFRRGRRPHAWSRGLAFVLLSMLACCGYMLQAEAAWQLYNWYEKECPCDKSILTVNLDETCIRCFETHDRGNVFKLKRGSASHAFQRQPRNKHKKCLTYVAMICDNAEAQRLLPQFVLGNCNTFLKREWEALAKECGANLILVRLVLSRILCM